MKPLGAFVGVVLATVIITLSAVRMPGCAGIPPSDPEVDKVVHHEEDALGSVDSLMASLSETDKARLAPVVEAMGLAVNDLKEAAASLKESRPSAEKAGEVAKTVASFVPLPPPLDNIAMSLAGIVGTWLAINPRVKRYRESADKAKRIWTQLVAGIDEAKKSDAQFSVALDAVGDKIRRPMDNDVQRTIDEAREYIPGRSAPAPA